MSSAERLVIGATMVIALGLGFVDPLWPEALISCKRLHIFFFNLTCGGTLIISYSAARAGGLATRAKLFFLVSLLYALSAAAGFYALTLILSIPLFGLVEATRIRRFSLLPRDFFGPGSVAAKFNHAALLCLSTGIVIAGLVIINNKYLMVVTFPKLTLDVFFLGYSFPISLITMSVMFSFMTDSPSSPYRRLAEQAAFWLVNLGVIIFFVFIIFELLIFEIIISIILFLTVAMIFALFMTASANNQQRIFLISGMCFLLLTAVTGIGYIFGYYLPSFGGLAELLLVLHATIALYGWNLSGLFIIMRWNDFPIRLSSPASVLLHWLTVLVLAPLGRYYPLFGVVALPAYLVLLGQVLLSRAKVEEVK